MIIRLGYVAMTLELVDSSPSGTLTLAGYNKLSNDEARLYKLRKITAKNLENTLRILRYNKAMNIMVYRLTSRLVPLATHPVNSEWDYTGDFRQEFAELGSFIKENNFRVSAHPDHFTLINSSSGAVLGASLVDLDYHVRLFEAMKLEDYRYKLVMHIGGLYKDKAASISRFKENFVKLPDRIRRRIILENDDKSYSASDVLELCNELEIPMVLDVHHYNCVNDFIDLERLLPLVFDTWKGEALKPKVHFSSPRNSKEFRSHADDIDFKDFLVFLRNAASVGRDFDIMLEAKNKDRALLLLSSQLSETSGIRKISQSEFEIY
ncbi:MAG: UV damage endonuclease UvsE [Clostridiales bacterium GWC2_40_7]|nr:MAG: UV damage endonuclease UvsE [Clostridiales bacterium GWC2_40_7]